MLWSRYRRFQELCEGLRVIAPKLECLGPSFTTESDEADKIRSPVAVPGLLFLSLSRTMKDTSNILAFLLVPPTARL